MLTNRKKALGWLLGGGLLLGAAPALAQAPAAGSWCGTPPTSPAERARVLRDIIPLEQRLAAGQRLTGNPARVPLRVFAVRRTDGSGGPDEAAILAAITGLNQRYAAGNLEFYLCGPVRRLDNSAWLEVSPGAVEQALCVPHDDPAAINVYYTQALKVSGMPVCGYAYRPGNRVVISCNDVHVLAHELGHALGLAHPQQDCDNPVVAERELVRRTNCTATGDQICDTPADPYGRAGATAPRCAYTGTVTDANGDRFSPLLNNVMGYWRCTGQDEFTPGQFLRMQATFQVRFASLNCAAPPPPAPTQLTATLLPYGGGVSLRWTNPAPGAAGYAVERAAGTSPDFETVATVPASSTAYTDPAPPARSLVRYRVRPVGAADAPASNEASAQTELTYCAAGFYGDNCPPTGLAIYLNEVQVLHGTDKIISNLNSGCGTYSSFVAQPGQVQLGEPYTLRVGLPKAPNGGVYPQLVSAWADYNHNGRFDDPGERLFQGPVPNDQLTTSFVVPAAASLGWTRLRVRAHYDFEDYYAPLTDACEPGVYGETEDYTLLVVPHEPVAGALPSFELFPNPASPQAPPSVLLSAIAPGPVQLLVYNVLGQRVLPPQQVLPGLLAPLPVQGLRPGFYLVQTQSPAGRSQRRLVLR